MSSGFDPRTAPASAFAAHSADAYEQVMGRWSRRLAPLLIRFGGLADGDRVLDVGCGTGSLNFALPEAASVAAVVGIDQAEVYLASARSRAGDLRFSFRHADARALPFPDASFDRAYSMLVLQFIPDADRAVAEMCRVVRPGGCVTAAVWDSFGGLPHQRLLWDTAAVLDPSAVRPRSLFRSLSEPDAMATLWRRFGLRDVEQTSLTIRMDFASFEDYWQPFTTLEGGTGEFMASLSATARATLREHMQRGYISNRPDGPRSFTATAWACRGTVPATVPATVPTTLPATLPTTVPTGT
jgi:ubiquinone/menaquinone biosynthesis C-methylase UbiE